MYHMCIDLAVLIGVVYDNVVSEVCIIYMCIDLAVLIGVVSA
jgi:hypothetical protein